MSGEVLTARVRLICLHVVNDEGERYLEPNDLAVDGEFVSWLSDECMKHSGFAEVDIGELESMSNVLRDIKEAAGGMVSDKGASMDDIRKQWSRGWKQDKSEMFAALKRGKN